MIGLGNPRFRFSEYQRQAAPVSASPYIKSGFCIHPREVTMLLFSVGMFRDGPLGVFLIFLKSVMCLGRVRFHQNTNWCRLNYWLAKVNNRALKNIFKCPWRYSCALANLVLTLPKLLRNRRGGINGTFFVFSLFVNWRRLAQAKSLRQLLISRLPFP